MTRQATMPVHTTTDAANPARDKSVSVGVGLRHPHYQDMLSNAEGIDFIEVHAENFYMDGGLALDLLSAVRTICPVSIHATSLGLGGTEAIPENELNKLSRLVERIDPLLVSDHAAFSWVNLSSRHEVNTQSHAGDLLPLIFNRSSLQALTNNIDRVQQHLGRQLLIENLSSYINLPGSVMQEFEFLQEACEKTGAGLLLDLNNIYVNTFNSETKDPLTGVINTLQSVSAQYVGEIHLAGAKQPMADDLMVDDHSTHVHEAVWQAFSHVVKRFGPTPTLIEWDNDLPSWTTLTQEAGTARKIWAAQAAAV